MLAAALEYAEFFNVPVFPVGRDCRQPLCEHGHKDASSDPAEIRKLWSGHPDANVAGAMGFRAGVFAIDVDTKGANGFVSLDELQEAHGSLPVSWRSRTPSGGEHVFFRQPDRGLRNRVGFRPGLDVRTTGGSVALPPSRKAHGGYAWIVDPTDMEIATAPGWLLDVIDPPEPPREPLKPIRLTSHDRTTRYVEAAVNGECGELARMGPNTGRNLKLFQAAANLGQLVGAGLLGEDTVYALLERAAEECGLIREDGLRAARASIASGLRRGVANPRDVRR